LYLQEPKFLSQEISLPPLSEQSRIVARIEELSAKIEEARGLRHEAVDEAETLLANSSADILLRSGRNAKLMPLGDVATKITDGEHIRPRRTVSRINLLSVHSPFFAEKFRVMQ